MSNLFPFHAWNPRRDQIQKIEKEKVGRLPRQQFKESRNVERKKTQERKRKENRKLRNSFCREKKTLSNCSRDGQRSVRQVKQTQKMRKCQQ